jgi:predicted metal-dependent hydrolase
MPDGSFAWALQSFQGASMRHRPTPTSVSRANTAIDGLDADIEVRRHPGARRMTLRVSRTKRAVIVTMPMQCDLTAAGTFLNRHLDWVRDRLGTLPMPVPFDDGVVMPVRGAFHRVRFTADLSARVLVDVATSDDGLVLSVHGRAEHAGRHLKAWLFEQARRDLDDRVLFHASRLKVRAKRIAVRDQTSRWGSCSTTGVLSFSWRLVLAPPLILDYVAAHEVAHLAEMNHGPRFWALVRQTMPQMDEAKLWLTARGMDLHRYGAE